MAEHWEQVHGWEDQQIKSEDTDDEENAPLESASDSDEEQYVVVDSDSDRSDRTSDDDYPGSSSPDGSGPVTPPPATRKRKKPSAVSPEETDSSAAGWKTTDEPDVLPQGLKRFSPRRKPGVQIFTPTDNPTPSQLFKTFFDEKTVKIICDNTNKQTRRNIEKGKKFKWHDITSVEFYKFLGLLFYMNILKLPAIFLYWRQKSIFSVASPASVMSRNLFESISWNIHMSDPDQDAANDKKKGTPEYDSLHKIRPLYDQLRNTCKAFYHPRQNISIDERKVAIKDKHGNRECLKKKLTDSGIKLFALADSSNGYTSDFTVYTGSSRLTSGHGISYNSVMALIDRSYLGCGYHLYCDNFYTSPKLFKDLISMNVYACGTYKHAMKGTPTTRVNALTRKSKRGTIRWIRNGQLLFTKWMDTKEVNLCSTIHTAYSGETTKKRAKGSDGKSRGVNVPVPNTVRDYNKHRGGVDLSEQLTQYYSVHKRSRNWYMTFFRHFLDIAATNSYIIYKELCQMRSCEPVTHLRFMETLCAELCGWRPDKTSTSLAKPSELYRSPHTVDPPSPLPNLDPPPACYPVAINPSATGSNKASEGRLMCVKCRKKTAWKCENCDLPLCLILDRNCYKEWHRSFASEVALDDV